MADISRKRKNFSKHTAEVVEYRNEPPGCDFEHNGVAIKLSEHKKSDSKNDLAWCFALILWRRRHEVSKPTLQGYADSLVRWWEFRDARWSELCKIEELTNEVLSDFLFWSINLAERKLHRREKNDFRVSTGTVKKWFQTITMLLEELQKENRTNPTLVIPKGVFNQDIYENTPAYSTRERLLIVQACTKDIKKIRLGDEVTKYQYKDKSSLGMMSKLLPFALLLALRTGLNSSVLLNLDIDCVTESFLGNGKRLRCPIKGRSGKSQYIPLTEENSRSIRIKTREVDLINDVLDLTKSIRENAPKDLKKKLWILRTSPIGRSSTIKLFSDVDYYQFFDIFVKRHHLTSDQGKPLHLNFKRLRPTFAEGLLKVSGGDINEVRKRMNHSSTRTTLRYFDPNIETRQTTFKFSGLVMQSWALGKNGLPDKDQLINDLKLNEEEAQKLLNGDFNMGVAKCKNPLDSPLKTVQSGEICRDYIGCFRCPNFVALKEDAHRLFSFYWYLRDKENQMSKSKWQKNYQWIIDVISHDIAPKLGDDQWIEREMDKAKLTPHPLWVTDNLKDV
jgi:integrase